MRVVDLGLTDFMDAYAFQKTLLESVSRGDSENTLIITEHKPVITIGRSGSRNNIFRSEEFLLAKGIEVFTIDRGGDVTYHGPGQVVAYPVFRLENEARDIHLFLRYLEDVGSHLLSQYGVCAERKAGLRGLWVGDKKIGSIGIGVRKWVTYHGLAVNINVDLKPFSFIRPCGIEGVEVTSLKELLGQRVDIQYAKNRLKLSFKEVPLLVEAFSN